MPHFIIYCDESSVKGRFYSDFYGGAILDARDQASLEKVLNAAKGNCQGEMKWTKISEYNEDDYKKFIDAAMSLVAGGFLKFRIMFTQNINHIKSHKQQNDNQTKYIKLYYQFVKHAFGLRYCNPAQIMNIDVTIYLDQVPITPSKFNDFKHHMSELSSFSVLKEARVSIKKENITDVDSSKHVILQAVDVILGAMQFRLNDKHKELVQGKKRRAKRTKAKERVYKHLNGRIQEIYPRFNVGTSTGQSDGPQVRWAHAYRHWCFKPTGSSKDLTKGKNKKGSAPQKPT